MRICVVGPTYPYRGGIAHYTTLLVRHLRLAGHRAPLYSFIRQYPRWLFPGKTDRDPSSTPLRVDCEYILDPINPLTWLRLVRRVRADNPELLVLQWWVPYWTPCLTAIGWMIKRNTRIKLAFICHNVMPHDAGVLDKRLALTVLRYGDALVVHSDEDRYKLHALLPNAHIIKAAIPTYEPLARQSAPVARDLRRELGLPAGVPVLLFFGFVRPYKGLEYLIRALPHLRERLPDAHLVVAGEFWSSREFYERYAREFGVEGQIRFVDRYIPDEDLQPYFELADVVVLPYVSATQSAVAQLAFGFNKPVITTRVGGLAEVVHDGVNGLIVPPQDAEALADAVARFFTEDVGRQIREHMAAGGPGGAYTWEDLVRALEGVARDLKR